VGTIVLLAEQRGDGVVYRYDNTNPDARTARMIADRAIEVAAGRKDVVTAENELVHETGSRYIDFVVPGLLGMNLMGSAMWGLGFSIVDGRQKKLLKRMVASPMPRWQFLAAYLLSRLVMLAIEVAVFLGFAKLVFGVPFRGPLWQLALLCVLHPRPRPSRRPPPYGAPLRRSAARPPVAVPRLPFSADALPPPVAPLRPPPSPGALAA
jgi:hypothetical protein